MPWTYFCWLHFSIWNAFRDEWKETFVYQFLLWAMLDQKQICVFASFLVVLDTNPALRGSLLLVIMNYHLSWERNFDQWINENKEKKNLLPVVVVVTLLKFGEAAWALLSWLDLFALKWIKMIFNDTSIEKVSQDSLTYLSGGIWVRSTKLFRTFFRLASSWANGVTIMSSWCL